MIHYTPQLSIGIVDIRSFGYYNVRKSIMSFDKRGNNRIPPLPYKVPKLHLRNYYKTSQLEPKGKTIQEPSLQGNDTKDTYPWLDEDNP